MKRATVIAHELIAASLEPGDVVIDATVGNGYDTLFLARLVGGEGHVYGFDIQQEALASAGARLTEAGVASGVTLIHGSHAEMAKRVPVRVKAVMFNLGYLPGGDPETITNSASTLSALEQARSKLLPGGLLTCACYPGHPGGLDEAETVLAWAKETAPDEVECYNEKGRHEGRPFLVSLRRRAS